LKKRYAKVDEIPEALRGFYEQRDGAYVLKLEDDDAPAPEDKGKLAEMRNTNIALQKQLAALQEQVKPFAGLDAETLTKAMEALSKTQNSEELELVKSGRLDEVVNRRTQAMQTTYQKQLEALNKAKEDAAAKEAAARKRFAGVYMAQQVSAAIEKSKLRLRPSAKDDLLMRAERKFAVTPEMDGLVASDQSVDPMGKPWTTESWVQQLVDEAPHLWEGGGGGGTGGGSPGGKRKIQGIGLSGSEFTKAAEDVAAGRAEWVS